MKKHPPFKRSGGEIQPPFHCFPASLKLPIMLLRKSTYTPLSKGKGGSAPIMHPRSGVLAEINRYQIPKHQKGVLWTTTNFKVTITIRSP